VWGGWRSGARRAGTPPKPCASLAPVWDRGIRLIETGRLYYRGTDVVTRAKPADLESVACLLWGQAGPNNFEVGRMQVHLRRLLKNPRLPSTVMDLARVVRAEL